MIDYVVWCIRDNLLSCGLKLSGFILLCFGLKVRCPGTTMCRILICQAFTYCHKREWLKTRLSQGGFWHYIIIMILFSSLFIVKLFVGRGLIGRGLMTIRGRRLTSKIFHGRRCARSTSARFRYQAKKHC